MALDEALWHSVREGQSLPVLRLYRWHPAAVSLGYGQRGLNIINRLACSELGLDVVRRITGGRAVLHDKEVTYAVISPEESDVFSGGVLSCYKIIAEILRQTLTSFGLPVALSPGRAKGSHEKLQLESACFTAASYYELVCHGCKIAGSSQKRGEGVFLQHGSIPLDLNLETLYRALVPAKAQTPLAGEKVYGSRVGWINRWSAIPVTVDQVEARLVQSFIEMLDVEFCEGTFTDEEWRLAEQLMKDKYANAAWNLKGILPEDIS